MTNYLSETNFRNCKFNFLGPPYPFILQNNKIVYNPDYHKETSILKILAIDDTFHDLSKDRDGYSNVIFNNNGPLNYLMTGEYMAGNYVKTYKKELNLPDFSNSEPGKSFESKVAKSIEINNGLQSAEVKITYDEILAGFQVQMDSTTNSITINIDNNLKQKVILSNGSLSLFINKSNPNLANLDNKNINFSNYMIAITSGNENLLRQYYLQIAYFIRWYLHSSDLNNFNNLNDPNFTITMPYQSMKILSDAGISFLGDFFGVENSGVTPFIAVPCFLDSASTSVSPLDPNIPIVFENLSPDKIIPIVSNYFSCNEYFICYLLNENSTFDVDNIFNFSLAIIKINEENINIVQAIEILRNNHMDDPNYISASNVVKEYMDTYPQLVARYYFGELEKKIAGVDSDNLKCGTCGAGVPYIGKVMKLLTNLIQQNKINISGDWNAPNINNYKNYFNSLKTAGPLKSKIPISDSRILKLFCYLNPNGNAFMNMNPDNFLSLFKLLCDYKRTGDYQQSYAVLKQILSEGNNANCYTFSSGDELSTLVGRLLGVPSIYQVGAYGYCSLYRCNLLNASPSDILKLKIINSSNQYKNYTDKIIYKLELIYNFINTFYPKICDLRKQLFELYQLTQNNLLKNNTGLELFTLIKLWNANSILSNLINLSNDFQSPESIQKYSNTLQKIYQNNDLMQRTLSTLNNNTHENQLTDFLNFIEKELEDIANIDILFTLFDTINNEYPLIINGVLDYFNPLSEIEMSTITFNRKELDLFFKKGKDEDTITKAMIKYILSQKATAPSRSSSRNSSIQKIAREQKKLIEDTNFVNDYNKFISSMKINNKYEQQFQIATFNEFNSEFIRKILVESNNNIQENNTISCDENMYHVVQQNLQQYLSILQSNNPSANIVAQEMLSQKGGNTYIDNEYGFFNQKGGTLQQFNAYCICNEIKEIFLKLTNKCSLYISNVIGNINLQGLSLPQLLLDLSNRYETNDFCYQLLNDQDDEYGIENEIIGFTIALKNLAEKYVYSDIMENHIRKPDGYDFGDELLNVNDMLDILQLPYIKLIIYLFSWSNMDFVLLSNELISLDLIQQYENACNTISLTLEECCFMQFLNDKYKNYFTIYEYLRTPVLFPESDKIKSIFSILLLAYIYNIYYHSNSSNIGFYDSILGNITSTLLSQMGETRGLAYLRDPPFVFLNEKLPLLLNTISSNLMTSLGAPVTATGPSASASGLTRSAQYQGIYPKGGKTNKNMGNRKNINKSKKTLKRNHPFRFSSRTYKKSK